jgi:hypothetical protein
MTATVIQPVADRTELTTSVLLYAEEIIRATLRDYPNSARHIEYAQTFLKLPPTPIEPMVRPITADIGWNWVVERAAA